MSRKLLILVIIVGLLLPPLAGCSKNPPAQDKQALTKVTILLDWLPNTNHTGLYVAKEKNYFKNEGLDVQIMQPGEGGTAQLVAAGKGDIGISYQEELTIARSQDIPIIALAAVIQHNTSGFASPVEKGITSPRDFEGKSYGGWGSPAETAVIKALMDKYQADFSKVKMLNIGEADFFTSMHKGVDFAWIYWGWTGVEAEQRNIDLNFIKLQDENPALDFYTPVIITSEKMLKENPELVQKFMRACSKGYQFTIENPEEAAELLLKNEPDLDRSLVMASQKYLANEYQADAPRWGEMKEEVWKNYADFMYKNKLIDKNIDPDKAFTNKYLP
ncbi:MAG: ABC transporter substrate-binding protein [Syntrophomonadaceae bacterium]|jgi:ABC-type nitrate/sulfonate/bicarbonate transport system substrate-binding protein|nr:ABC transporter substrate-binding protein [Syntrophomonadaceae bacterium]